MRSTLLGFSLTALILVACAPLRETGGGGSGGAAGSGGSSDGSGGSGGDSSSSGGSGGSGGDAGSGGNGSGGSGGAEPNQKDAALDMPGESDALGGGAGGAAGNGGRTTKTGPGTGGKPGTGGSPGTGGLVGTGGNNAPTPCTFPASWKPGNATYTTYSLPNPITACGYEGSNNTIKNIVNGGNFAAIPGNTSEDFQTRDRCGACVKIGNAIITIVDECPNDSNPPCRANPGGHLDLSNAGAGAAGVRGDPNVYGQNPWNFVPCPVNGNVIVRLKQGNNNEMFIENVILPIKAVTCSGLEGSRTFYGAWHFSQNIPGAMCEVTDLAGRKLAVKAGTTQGQNVDTGLQFPKCL